MRVSRRALACLTAVVLLANAAPKAMAQADAVSVDTTPGYARLLFTFQTPTPVSASVADGVLTIRLGKPSSANVDTLVQRLGRYVTSGRRDADGLTYHFALASPVALHSSTQGNHVAVDLVPDSYKAAPPDLPPPPPPPSTARALVDVAKLPIVKLRVAEYANFTRLIFDWPAQVSYTAYPGQGRISLRFESLAKPDFSMLESRSPPWVKNAGWHLDDKTLVVEFDTDPGSTFHDSRDGKQIFVDVLAPKTDASAYKPPPVSQAAPAKPVPPGTDAATMGAPVAGGPPASLTLNGAAPAMHVTPSASLTRDGAVFHFPGARGHAVAVFSRGATVWIVLDDMPALDPVTLLAGVNTLIDKAEANMFGSVAVLRLTLKMPLVASVTETDSALDVTFAAGNPSAPAPIVLTREGVNGMATLSTPLPGAMHLVTLTDPAAGDTILVVPARPGRGILTAKHFLELDAMPTAAGLAIVPHADDLEAKVENELVTFTRPNGLTLSEAAGINPAPTVQTRPSAEGPTFINFAEWGQTQDPNIYEQIHTLRLATAKMPESTANKGRLRLAQYLFAEGLAPEALGEIELMQTADPRLTNDPALQVLTGAAQYSMGRYEDAGRSLSAASFDADPHVALWRGLTEAKLNDWANARRNLQLAQRVLRLYPTLWQTRVQLARAETGLATSDLASTNDALDQLPGNLPPHDALQASLLKARLLAAQGHLNEATAQLKTLEQSDYAPVAAHATYARVDLQLSAGKIKHADAIEALERLRFRWRGDDLELATLRRLGSIYFADKRWREGLETLRSAAINFPKSELARSAQDDTRQAFVDLFLNGKADTMKPVDAVSLFYDFIELTPIGRDGDEMIRKLSDRLVTVDLLGPAEELLEHQVTQRLDGVAQASVATRLALIYLLDHKPKGALKIINDTRQTGLPDDLNAQRRLLEARALAGLQEYDAGVNLIADDDSQEARDLRADIYWQASNWTLAAGKAEELLGDRWQAAAPLTDADRVHVMRAAVAYSLANDDAGLTRLRDRYTTKMGASPDAKAFAAVTDPSENQGLALRDLAKKIASVDSLQAFMVDFRQRQAAASGPSAKATN